MAHDEPLVRFPVSCPICRRLVLAEYRHVDVVGALLNDRPIRLYAACCDKSWTASYIEVRQIGAHLGTARLESRGRHAPDNGRELLDD